jgi:TusA-related sulfurtransferase
MTVGFSSERREGFVLHILSDSTEESIRVWEAEISRLIERTPPGEAFRVLIDMSSSKVRFTRLARERCAAVLTRYHDRQGKLALLFSGRVHAILARLFLASLGHQQVERACFSKRDAAIRWLEW